MKKSGLILKEAASKGLNEDVMSRDLLFCMCGEFSPVPPHVCKTDVQSKAVLASPCRTHPRLPLMTHSLKATG